jgi:hypothetical protein
VPTRLLSDPELDQLTSWPLEIAHSDLVEFFTLDLGDLRWLRTHAGAMNRLGLAIQLCALRYLGFIPGGLGAPPAELPVLVASDSRSKLCPKQQAATITGAARPVCCC